MQSQGLNGTLGSSKAAFGHFFLIQSWACPELAGFCSLLGVQFLNILEYPIIIPGLIREV